MTDAVLDGGAPAPADTSVSLRDDVINADSPIDARIPSKEQPASPKAEVKAEKAPSASEAVKQAMEKIKAETEAKAKDAAENAKGKVAEAEAKQKAEAKQEQVKPDKPRDETGKFQSQQPRETAQQAEEALKVSAYRDPPSRFDDAAKAEWEKVPESVRGATNRAFAELEQGIQKYRSDSERYERIREFDDIAKGNGRDLKDSLAKVAEVEKALARNPIAGLDLILREIGPKKADGSPITLLDVAAHIMNQTPDQRAMQQNTTISGLQVQVAELTRQLGGVSQTIQQQSQNATLQQVQAFAADPKHARFDELSRDIGFFLETKRASNLQEAYELAERLNPSASAPEPLTPAPKSPELAHTQAQARPLNPAGQKSIGGAPSSGNLKPTKGRVMSNSEAIRLAMEKVG